MIQAIRGTKDILPDTMHNWHYIEDVFRKSSAKFSYNEVRTPIFEKTEVFSRGIGENTDVVNKEMYTFESKGGDSITLRPEMTAAIGRSVLQNSLIQQSSVLRYWYFGPFFRYENPQKGRQRQFHQYGAETIGSPYPESDIENIALANDIIKSAGIKEYQLLLNSIGNTESRMKFRQALVEYFSGIKDQLSEDSQNRLDKNPLRILDSKNRNDIEAVKNAPVITDYLDEESSNHFNEVKAGLEKLGIEYREVPTLVRGLDYYCHTVFEFQSSALGAQDSFGGGGRYNGLLQQLGSKKEVPAVGFAMGVERLLLVLEAEKALPENAPVPDFYVICAGDSPREYSLNVINKLRSKGHNVLSDILRRSMKAQFREANKSGAPYTVIIGEDEMNKNILQVKKMETSEQKEISVDDLDYIKF